VKAGEKRGVEKTFLRMDFNDFFWVGSQKVKIMKARLKSFKNDTRKKLAWG